MTQPCTYRRTICQTKSGQFLVTIPRRLVERFAIKKGDHIYFLVDEPSEYIKLKKNNPAETLYSDIEA